VIAKQCGLQMICCKPLVKAVFDSNKNIFSVVDFTTWLIGSVFEINICWCSAKKMTSM